MVAQEYGTVITCFAKDGEMQNIMEADIITVSWGLQKMRPVDKLLSDVCNDLIQKQWRSTKR